MEYVGKWVAGVAKSGELRPQGSRAAEDVADDPQGAGPKLLPTLMLVPVPAIVEQPT